jgi:hypothetical protein
MKGASSKRDVGDQPVAARPDATLLNVRKSSP